MPHTVDFYLSRGFDRKAAEYFASGRRKPVKVVVRDKYSLLITFDNNEVRLFDVKPLLKEGTVYDSLKNIEVFNRCYIDSNSSICWDKDPNLDSKKIWSNKIDIGADTCYLESSIVPSSN